MGKDIIDTTCMHVKLLAKVLDRHGTTLDVPARKATSPWAIPCHLAPWFRGLPQGKVLWIMAVGIYPLAYTRQHVFKLIARELPIARKTLDIKVDKPIDLVGNALCQQALDNRNHFWNMLCGAWKDVRGQDIEFGFILVECICIKLRDF